MGTRLLFLGLIALLISLGSLAATRGRRRSHFEDEITPVSRDMVNTILTQLQEGRDSLTPKQSAELQRHLKALLRGLTLDLAGKESRSSAPLDGFLLAAAHQARAGKSLEALEIIFKAIALSEPGATADSLIGAAIDLAAKARVDTPELLAALDRVSTEMARSHPTDLRAQAILARVREAVTTQRIPETLIDPAAFPPVAPSGPEEEGALTIGSESEFSDTAETFLHSSSKEEEEEEEDETGARAKKPEESTSLHAGSGGSYPSGSGDSSTGSGGLELTPLSASSSPTGGEGLDGGIYGAGKMGSTGMYAFKRGKSLTSGSGAEQVFVDDINFDKPFPPFEDETEYLLYFEDLYRPALRLIGEGYDLSRMLLERMIEMIEKCIKAFANSRIFDYKDLQTFRNLPSSLYHLLAQRIMLKAKLAQRNVADGNFYERRTISAYSIKGVLYVCALAIKHLGERDSTCNSLLESIYVLYDKNAIKSMKSNLLPDSIVSQIQDAFLETGRRLETERHLLKTYQNQLLQQIYENGRKLEMSNRAGSLALEAMPSTSASASSIAAAVARPVGGLSAKASTGEAIISKLRGLIDAGTPISLDGLTEEDYREIAKVKRACILVVLNAQPASVYAHKALLAKHLCNLPVVKREARWLPSDRHNAWAEVCGYRYNGVLFWVVVIVGIVLSSALVFGVIYYCYHLQRRE